MMAILTTPADVPAAPPVGLVSAPGAELPAEVIVAIADVISTSIL